ncbi:MAG: xly 1, partial [Verrucomicrobiales bacterium]|nr:xly 1 [Verrucomicrobiales bacterium]
KPLLATIVGLALSVSTMFGAAPKILSSSPGVGFVWTNPVSGNLSIIEQRTNLSVGAWTPLFYDVGSNGLRSTAAPISSSNIVFYRIGVQTNIPDPSLIMNLSFDNAFSNGVVLDISGHGNNGLRYGKPCCPTNWPTLTVGPDGSQAAEFHQYFDGWGLYGKSGDYVAIPYSPLFINLSQVTVCAWVWLYRAYNGDINNDHNTSILDTGMDVPGTFNLGRNYSDHMIFSVWKGSGNEVELLNFPDVAPDGNTGGWHYYSVTFSNGVVNGYFDGNLFQTANAGVPALTMAGYYMGIAGWTFNGTPEMDLSVDGYPNNAWINGRVDDFRFYNRALTSSEITSLYTSFDKAPPKSPSTLTATPVSSSQVSLHWGPGSGTFRIAGYVLRRNGAVIATTTNRVFFDSNLTPQSTNSYTVQCFDVGNQYSTESAIATCTTFSSGVNLIIDDADGAPWMTQIGTWPTYATLPGYYGTGFLSSDEVAGKSLVIRPPLPESGTYTVFMRYPGTSSINYLLASSVPVDIVHGGITNTVTVNEQSGYGLWNSLGQYNFSAGTNDFVQIRTDGTDGYYVFADAFLFIK